MVKLIPKADPVSVAFDQLRANNSSKKKKKKNIIHLLTIGKTLLDKYAGSKKRWWLNGNLNPSNHEADKKTYEEFCKGFEEYLK